MENKNISQIALQRIKGEGLKPISKKIFNIKKFLFWLAVGVSLVIGAFTFSLILSGLFNNDWDLYDKFGISFIFKTLPYFWFASFILFIILGEYYYRKTFFGYRHTILAVVGVYIVSTIAFGSIFYVLRIGDILEQSLVDLSPTYRNIILNKHEVWTHPEDGLLSGKITKIGDGEIEIIDADHVTWVVDIANSMNRGQVDIKVGERVKIVGDVIEDNSFEADEMRSWVEVK
ncbi:MAG: hypothetical protein WC241_00600 [Candidatus Paceibacterota bacterium]|jgi:hypothetical protein